MQIATLKFLPLVSREMLCLFISLIAMIIELFRALIFILRAEVPLPHAASMGRPRLFPASREHGDFSFVFMMQPRELA